MKSSSSAILTLLGGVALGFAAAQLLKTKKAEELKESLEEKFQDLQEKVTARYDKWVEERSAPKCECKEELAE